MLNDRNKVHMCGKVALHVHTASVLTQICWIQRSFSVCINASLSFKQQRSETCSEAPLKYCKQHSCIHMWTHVYTFGSKIIKEIRNTL